MNAFQIAALHGHWKVMCVLAEHGIDIYNTDAEGNNVLHLCAKSVNHYEIFKSLVSSGYNVNIPNKKGDTASHLAAQKGNLRHLQALSTK